MAVLKNVGGATRSLFATPYTGEGESIDGQALVYLAIHDSTGMLGNINVDRAQLLAALEGK